MIQHDGLQFIKTDESQCDKIVFKKTSFTDNADKVAEKQHKTTEELEMDTSERENSALVKDSQLLVGRLWCRAGMGGEEQVGQGENSDFYNGV